MNLQGVSGELRRFSVNQCGDGRGLKVLRQVFQLSRFSRFSRFCMG